MSKYIDADKLYKKIDEQMAKFAKLEKETESDDMDLTLSIFYGGKRKMCSDILTLIDSLQQEQSEVDIEEEVKHYINENFTITDEIQEIPEEDRMYGMDKGDMLKIARHFYKLGLNVRKA